MNSLCLVPTEPQGLRALRKLYFELGQALSGHDRLPESIQAFEQALKEEGPTPDPDVVMFSLGRAYERADKPDNAFRSYLEAIAVAPQRMVEILPSVHGLLNRDLAVKQGEWLESQWRPKIKKADLAPVLRAEMARFLGRVSLYRGEYARGEELFWEAHHFSPDDPLALEGLGEVLWRSGKLPEALQLLTNAQEIAEKGGHIERLMAVDAKLAQVLVASGQYQVALDMIAKSLAEGDRFANELLLSRSQCYLALAEWDKALEAAKAAQERTPASIEARILSSQALIALGRCSDADKVVDEGLQYDLQSLDLLLYKAEALLEGQIEVDQGRRLLARYTERAGSAAVTPGTLPAALMARSADGNAQYFVAELYCALGYHDDALKAVEKALEIGLSGKTQYREAPAQQLKGRLLQNRDARGAAECFYEAGRQFLWRNDFDTAVELLRESADLDSSRAATYWQWAEALRMLSYQTNLHIEEQKARIQESIKIWGRSTELRNPGQNESWAYITRALISEQCANLLAAKLEQQRNCYWESAAFIERALLLASEDSYAWTCLCRCHRLLGNERTALQSVAKAWEQAPEDIAVLDERAAILASVGELEEAGKLIDKSRSQTPDPWRDGVKAYILSENRQYKEALELLCPLITANPDDLWSLALTARCFRKSDQKGKASKTYQDLLSKYDPSRFNDQCYFGTAAYHLGETERATKILSDYLKIDDDDT